MNAITFDFSLTRNFEEALDREWALQNPAGCSAAMSILGIPTRSAHGLFIPANQDHTGGGNLRVKNVDEQVLVGDSAYPLSTHLYDGSVYPDGYLNLDQVILSPLLTWVYRVEDVLISKTLMLPPEQPAVFLRYQILEGNPDGVRLELRPMLPLREEKIFDLALSKKVNGGGQVAVRAKTPAGRLYFQHNAAIVDRSAQFYKKIFYPADRKAGLDIVEDNFCAPFRLGYTFTRTNVVYLAMTADDVAAFDPVALMREAESRARAS